MLALFLNYGSHLLGGVFFSPLFDLFHNGEHFFPLYASLGFDFHFMLYLHFAFILGFPPPLFLSFDLWILNGDADFSQGSFKWTFFHPSAITKFDPAYTCSMNLLFSSIIWCGYPQSSKSPVPSSPKSFYPRECNAPSESKATTNRSPTATSMICLGISTS